MSASPKVELARPLLAQPAAPANAPAPVNAGPTTTVTTALKTCDVAKRVFAGVLGAIGIGVAVTAAVLGAVYALPVIFCVLMGVGALLCLIACAAFVYSARHDQRLTVSQTTEAENNIQNIKALDSENEGENQYVTKLVGNPQAPVSVYKPDLLTKDYRRSCEDYIFLNQSFREKYKNDFDRVEQANNANDRDSAEVIKNEIDAKLLPNFLAEVQQKLGPSRQHLMPKITKVFCQKGQLFINNKLIRAAKQRRAEICADRQDPPLASTAAREQFLKDAADSISWIGTRKGYTPKCVMQLEIPEDPTADVTITAYQAGKFNLLTAVGSNEVSEFQPIFYEGKTVFTIGAQERPDHVASKLTLS